MSLGYDSIVQIAKILQIVEQDPKVCLASVHLARNSLDVDQQHSVINDVLLIPDIFQVKCDVADGIYSNFPQIEMTDFDNYRL